MPRHLLDSDVLIWVLRGQPVAVDFIRDLLKEEVPAISVLAVYEVLAGARTPEEDLIRSFLTSFSVLPITAEIANEGARYCKHFRRKAITLSMADALIAATARTHRLILVTENQRDFPMRDIEKRGL